MDWFNGIVFTHITPVRVGRLGIRMFTVID